MKQSAWRLLAVGAITALSAALAAPVAHADPAPPAFTDGHGLTQVTTEPEIVAENAPGDFVITVTTPQLAGRHHLRIVLPDDYFSAPAKRHPVLYLLHGSPGDPATYFDGYRAVNGQAGMIIVMPDGGARSWYSDWRDQNTAAGPQKWDTFAVQQLIPFIDANLRTVATKQGRAIAGISMGGFGAFRVAQRHPALFSQVASMSGDLELGANQMGLRFVVVGSLIDAPGVLCSGTCGSVYSPAVSSDALFGSPYPVFNADRLWNENDPAAHAEALRGMGISIYVGNGAGNTDITSRQGMEWWLESASTHMRQRLDAAGIPVYWQNYGDGAAWGPYCDGGHSGGCWDQDLVDLVPRLRQAFGV